MCFMEGFAWLSTYLLLYITLSHFQGGRGSVGSEEAQTSNSRSCSGGVGCDFIFTLKELIYCGWIHRPLIQGTEPRVGKKVKFLQ